MVCSASGPDAPLVSSLADYLECQVSALGRSGFEGGADVFLTAMLAGCLTIYVALIGYRLILGYKYTPRDAILACLRVGLIVTFCTRWPSYEAVFYRAVVDGPQEIASQMLQSLGLTASATAGLAERVQEDYDAIERSAIKPPPASAASLAILSAAPPALGPPAPSAANTITPPAPAAATTPTGTFSLAGMVFVTSTIGSLLAVKLAAALLMAIGPLVLLLALFDSLVGLLENWVGALGGILVATVGVKVMGELELGFVEGRLAQPSFNDMPSMSDQDLLLTALLFSLCLLGVFIAAGLVGKRLRFRGFWLHDHDCQAQLMGSTRLSGGTRQNGPIGFAAVPQSRARTVANAISLEGRREQQQFLTPAMGAASSGHTQAETRSGPVDGVGGGSVPIGLGYSLRRPARANRSASYVRRGQRQ